MRTSTIGVSRPVWTAAPHHGSSHPPLVANGLAMRTCNKFHQTGAPFTGCGSEKAIVATINRVVSFHRPGAISFVGLRSLRKTTDVGKFGSRFGELSGDCCQASVGTTGRSSCKYRGTRAGAGSAAKGNDDSRNDGDEAGSPFAWDLPARHRRMQAAAAKVGDPFRDMMTNASKKLQDYLDNLKQSKTKEDPEDQKPQTEWENWQKFFADVDDRERLISVLKFQLEEAVDSENFQEAALLKETIASITISDTVSEVMIGLKSALEEERYSDAAKFRDKAGAGLVGWWVGLADGASDPYGRIIHISAAQGRFIAKSYSARQLATAAVGIPLFEVFVRKEGEGYNKQAVYLQRDGNVSPDTILGPTTKEIDLSGLISKDDAKENSKVTDTTESTDKAEEKPKDGDFIDEGLNNILSFIKERMPDVKLKVLQVISPEGLETDIPKLVEQLMEADEKEDANMDNETEVGASSESSSIGQSEQDKAPVGSSANNSSVEEQETPIRLVVGGILPSNLDDKPPRTPLRVAAKIEHKNKDEFLFHIDEASLPSQVSATSSAKESVPSWKVATIATQASTDLMPDDVAKVLWNVEKVPVKVSKEMGEIIRLAVSQAQRRRGLSKSTSFRRINVSDGGSDPLNGLYIGAFGPYTSEVVQLRRKYGQWQEDETSSSVDKLEFFEYVEAVKLTGDLNVPAGQITFRAKISRENRLSLRGAYPEELGVVGRYKGQGRLAEPGFRNPQWIDGELVLLDGKCLLLQGGGHTNGAELGFVYSVPERHFLVLFNRLKLQD